MNNDAVFKSLITSDRIIQKYKPVMMNPLSKYGRAQFYAPYKQIGNVKIDTFWFNLLVLWIVTFGLYIALYYKLLQKGINYLENMRLPISD
jgi:hypothetical protein